MSVARPTRSLVGRCLASTRAAPVAPCHQFHSSTARANRKPRFRNLKAEEMGLLKPENLDKYQKEHFPAYTKEQLKELEQNYTPEQLEAIKAGEEAVDPKDLIIQGRLRDDPYKPEYVEDYTVLDPRYDLKPEIKGTPQEYKFLNEEEWENKYVNKMADLTDRKTTTQLRRAMIRALKRVKQSSGAELIDLTDDELADMERDPSLMEKYIVKDDGPEPDADTTGPGYMTRAQAMKLDEAVDAEWKMELDLLASLPDGGDAEPTPAELLADGPAGMSRMYSAENADLGKVPGVEGLYRRDVSKDEAETDELNQELKRVTGMSLEEIKALYTRELVTRWVHNQTRLGKVRSASVTVIAGNGNGMLGVGMGKAVEPAAAIVAATMHAVRNMRPVPRYENRTIYGNVSGKVSGTVVELFARPPGFGLRVPHRIFEMCRAAGLHDIAARMPRSKNPMNSVKAAYKALMAQPDPDAIAIGRGKKLVDVRKVYYGGAV